MPLSLTFVLVTAMSVAPAGADQAVFDPNLVLPLKRIFAADLPVACDPNSIPDPKFNDELGIDCVDDKRVDVGVAIFDSGINLDDPNLNVAGAVDCTNATILDYDDEKQNFGCDVESPGAGDDNFGHGTGTALAIAGFDDGDGKAGVVPGARVYAVRDLPDTWWDHMVGGGGAGGFETDLAPAIAAVNWVAAHADEIDVAIGGPANICSFEKQLFDIWPWCSDTSEIEDFDAAAENLVDQGVVWVMQAGNLHQEVAGFVSPSNPNAITVSAMKDSDGLPGGEGSAEECEQQGAGLPLDRDDTSSNYSNWGFGVDIASPGCPTSQAGPYVAGAAAILASADDRGNYATGRDFVDAIRKKLHDAGNYGWTDEAGGFDAFSFGGVEVRCSDTEFQAALSAASSQLSLGTGYGNCALRESDPGLYAPVTVQMNSCHYELGVKATAAPYSGTLGIACTQAGDRIAFDFYAKDPKQPQQPGTYFCTVKIPPQSGLKDTGLSNIITDAGQTIAVRADIGGMQWEKSGPCVTQPEVHGDGGIDGEMGLRDISAAAEAVDIYLAEPQAQQPRFEADSYPVTVTGDDRKEPLLDVHDESVFDPKTIDYELPVDSDVNGDGRADLVALRANGVVYVHPGGADGKFGSGVASFSDGKGGGTLDPAQYDGEGHYVVDVADVDGDRRSDLVTVGNDGDLHVYAGKADGTFAAQGATSQFGLAPALLEAGGFEPIDVADVDGGGRADLIAYNDQADQIRVYTGRYDGTFGDDAYIDINDVHHPPGFISREDVGSGLHTGLGRHFVGADDVDGDGHADLVSIGDGGFEVMKGGSVDAENVHLDLGVIWPLPQPVFEDPHVSHQGEVDMAMDDGQGEEPVGLGDVDDDGRSDLLTVDTSGTVHVYPGEGYRGDPEDPNDPDTAGFGAAIELSGPVSSTFDSGYFEYLGLLDVNGDGRADLASDFFGSENDTIYVNLGKADGTLESPVLSDGTFPSTQHFKNQNASGNEFVTEKPSWRRRGCDPRGCGWVIDPTVDGQGSNDNRFTDVSCASASFCMATANLLSGTSYAYTNRWDGSKWSFSGIPSNAGIELTGVSCASASFCMAVGSHTEGATTTTAAYAWDGSQWSAGSTAGVDVPGGPNRLTDVSCLSAEFCFATAHVTAAGTTWSYGAEWDGSSWAARGGIPENGATVLDGVSCTGAASCVAVGRKAAGGGFDTYAVRWHGGQQWTTYSPPNGVGASDNRLSDVSCAAEDFCIATGNLLAGTTSYAYTEVWDGEAWSFVGIPANARVALRGVSCVASTECTAVGDHSSEAGALSTHAYRWDGSAWTRHYTPSPAAANSRLAGVSCLASGCRAVGSYSAGGATTTLGLSRR